MKKKKKKEPGCPSGGRHVSRPDNTRISERRCWRHDSGATKHETCRWHQYIILSRGQFRYFVRHCACTTIHLVPRSVFADREYPENRRFPRWRSRPRCNARSFNTPHQFTLIRVCLNARNRTCDPVDLRSTSPASRSAKR